MKLIGTMYLFLCVPILIGVVIWGCCAGVVQSPVYPTHHRKFVWGCFKKSEAKLSETLPCQCSASCSIARWQDNQGTITWFLQFFLVELCEEHNEKSQWWIQWVGGFQNDVPVGDHVTMGPVRQWPLHPSVFLPWCQSFMKRTAGDCQWDMRMLELIT